MYKSFRFLASLLAEAEAATDKGIRKSAGIILRQDVSADIFSIGGEWGGYFTCSACPSGSLLVSQKATMRIVSSSM